MQCPIPVEGKECGADAKTRPSMNIVGGDSTIHFHCTRGHDFHIAPRQRWQPCVCGMHQDVSAGVGPPRLDRASQRLLERLAAEKGIEVIFE